MKSSCEMLEALPWLVISPTAALEPPSALVQFSSAHAGPMVLSNPVLWKSLASAPCPSTSLEQTLPILLPAFNSHVKACFL